MANTKFSETTAAGAALPTHRFAVIDPALSDANKNQTVTGQDIVDLIGDSSITVFNPVTYGAVANGVTDCTAPFQAMMDAVYAAGGGIIWVPPSPGTFYKFVGSSGGTGPGWVIDPEEFGDVYNCTLRVYLNGAAVTYTGSDWWLVVKSNINQPNSTRGHGKRIEVHGGFANITGTASAEGCCLVYEQVQGVFRDFQANFFTAGTAFQIENTDADNIATSSCDGCLISHVWGWANKRHFYGKAPLLAGVPFRGSPFNMCRLDTLSGHTPIDTNDCTLFEFEGDWAASTITSCGGSYGYGTQTGNVGFRLNGYFEGVTIISPRLDAFGGFTSSHATDFVFGPEYIQDFSHYPVLINTMMVKIPTDYQDNLIVLQPGLSTVYPIYENTFKQYALNVMAHVWSGALPVNALSRVVRLGTLQSGPGLELDLAGNAWFSWPLRMKESFGYMAAAGVGGAVTQVTSKATGVTLAKLTGAITMHNASLAAGAKASFTVTNSTVAATDIPVVAVKSGGTTNAYRAAVAAVAAGSFNITLENITAGALAESPVISFNVIKGAID